MLPTMAASKRLHISTAIVFSAVVSTAMPRSALAGQGFAALGVDLVGDPGREILERTFVELALHGGIGIADRLRGLFGGLADRARGAFGNLRDGGCGAVTLR